DYYCYSVDSSGNGLF
nr:immunoglobulin light chain junction region [Macaca mulatta]MOW66784.1 immunoglobulin light chain junction region [Macaca mulatta]MOW72654.1 immunoglobulin light chain junction region [Macaca mulatta]